MTAVAPKRAKTARKRKPAKKLKAAGRQKVKEWIGTTPDTRAPPTVRLRVFEREGGICHITGQKIDGVRDKWDLDHKKRLEDGGENRESNLFPALREPHRLKTAAENKRAAKADRARMAHLGIKDEPDRPLESRNDLKRPPKEKKAADPFPHLPRRRLYE